MLPLKTLKLYVAKQAILCVLASGVTENELFMIIKLIVPGIPVLPLKYYFLIETSQSLNVKVLLLLYV